MNKEQKNCAQPANTTPYTETNMSTGRSTLEKMGIIAEKHTYVFSPEEIKELSKKHGSFLCYGDNGNVKRVCDKPFAELFQRHRMVIFSLDDGNFYIYSSQTGLWCPFSDTEMVAQITDFVEQYFIFLGTLERANVKLGKGTIETIVATLKSCVCQRDFFNQNNDVTKRWIHCANGVLEYNDNTKAWELKDFDSKYRSRFRCEIPYIEDTQPTRFINELISPAMDKADCEMLQYYCGQCLIGKNLSQTFLVMTGTPGGGKSTLVNIIQKIIGRQNCTELRLRHADSRFELSHCYGKTLLVGSDVSSDYLNSRGSQRLKALTGGDPLQIEWKGSKQFCEIPGHFNVMITSNSTLRVKQENDPEAWKRRMLWIRYDNAPPQHPIMNFDDVLLQSEGSGILNWMLAGAGKLLEHNGKIPLTQKHRQRMNDLLEETDPVRIYVRDYLFADSNSDMTTTELWDSFNTFIMQEDLPRIKKGAFQRRLCDAMEQIHKLSLRHDIMRNNKARRGYSGIDFSLDPVI